MPSSLVPWYAVAAGGGVSSVTAGDATVTVGGTAANPTIVVANIAQGQVTGLVAALAAKVASVTATDASIVVAGTATAPTVGGAKLANLLDVNVAGIADTQLVAWNAGAAKFQPASVTGASELVHTENVTGTGQTVTSAGGIGARVDITNLVITNLTSPTRPAWLTVQFHATLTAVGVAGSELWVAIVETTGAPTDLNSFSLILPSTLPGVGMRGIDITVCSFRLGTIAGGSPRSFKVQAYIVTAAAQTSTIVITNGAANPSYFDARAL